MNHFDGETASYAGVTWRHGVNELFEFWTHTTPDKLITTDIARNLATSYWDVYQHIERPKRGGSTLMLTSGTTHLDGSFTHGKLFHVEREPHALMQAASERNLVGSDNGGEPVSAINCPFCVEERKHLPVSLGITSDLEQAEQALSRAREHLFAARDKVLGYYGRAELFDREAISTLYTVGNYLEQAAGQAGSGWVHANEGARGRLQAILKLLSHRDDIKP
jgi:hypothetical protein